MSSSPSDRRWAARPGSPSRSATSSAAAGSWTRLLAHGVVRWGAHAAALAGLLAVMGRAPATALHVILVLAIFTALAWCCFRRPGAREPWPAALAIAATTGLCDLVAVSPLLEDALARWRSLGLTWLPVVAIVLCVWATGAVMATLPWPKLPRPVAPAAR